MPDTYFKTTLFDGVWRQNPALVQLLGLCPLLAVSNTVVNGAGLGIATLLTLIVSNLSVSLCRPFIHKSIRLPVYVLIIATTVTVIEQLMAAYFTDLHKNLGLFLPLIVTNCLILGRAEALASRVTWRKALSDALAMGLGFLLVVTLLGAIREWLGPVLLIAMLPPGAFITLGLFLAIKNIIDSYTGHNKPSLARHVHPLASTETK